MTLATAWLVYGGFATVLGLLVGSFLNVCIARMPEDRSIVHPPSHCPACGHGVRPRDNIPVLSWLLLRGRCRDCQSPISSLYPTVELLTGLLALLLYRRLIPGPAELDPGHAALFVVQLCFMAMLVAITFIDLRHTIIPDEMSIYAAPFGILAAAALTALHVPGAPTWQQSVVGALIGGGSLGLVSLTYWLIKRQEGMGLGDVKLLAMIGAFLGGLPAIPFVLLVSSCSAAVVGVSLAIVQRKGSKMAFPYGPFLAFAAVLYLLHGRELVERWMPGLWMMVASEG